MTITLFLAIAGCCLGVYSAILSTLNFRRDREKLKAQMLFVPSFIDDESGNKIYSKLRIEAANSGRRVIILRFICIKYKDETERKQYLEGKGISLTEKQTHTVLNEDLRHLIVAPEDGCVAVDIWFEDTLGDKHKIRNVKKCLNKYFSKNEVKEPKSIKILPTPTKGAFGTEAIEGMRPTPHDPNDPIDHTAFL